MQTPQNPFGPGSDRWDNVYQTPWYSMFHRDNWFAIDVTSGVNPAVVLPVDSLNRVLLVEVYRPALDRVVLECPRGFLEVGETARAGARRELAEETGIDADSKDLIDLGIVYPDSGVMRTMVSLFAVKLKKPFEEVSIDKEELLGSRLMPLSQLEKMLDAGLVCDSFLTVAVKRYLANDGSLSSVSTDSHGIEVEIDVLDEVGTAVLSLRTRRPDWSFHQYCRNRETVGWTWRFRAKDMSA